MGVNQCFSIIETLTLYPQFFVLYFVTSLMSDVLNNYARGIEKVSDVAIGGIIGSVSMLTLNVLFLLVFKWGLRLGTFQLSDIFYNTVGGVLGGLMYCAVMKARKRL